jgi:hypothetical protein
MHGRRFRVLMLVPYLLNFSYVFILFPTPAQHEKAHDALRPFLRSRATQLAQEFAFLPTSPPREEGGIFELRAYQLSPGTLLEWEATWFTLHTAFRLPFSSHCTIGERVLRHAGNLFDLSVHGTGNLVGCTRFTTSGSTSAYTSTVIPGGDGIYLKRTETSRPGRRCVNLHGSRMGGQTPYTRRVLTYSRPLPPLHDP